MLTVQVDFLKKTYLIGILMFFSLTGLSFLSPAWAKSESEIQEDIQSYLYDRHASDTPQWWQSLGPKAPQVIIQIYEKSDRVDHKTKLIHGLGAFDQPLVADFLKKQIADSEVPDVIRGESIRGVIRSQGVHEIDFVAQYLKDEDEQIRFAVADSLKKLNHPKAKSILDRYRTEEKQSWILSRLDGKFPETEKKTAQPVSNPTSTPATGPIAPRSEIEGSWIGYWIVPRTDMNSGMKSEGALLSLETLNSSQIQGTVSLKKKGTTRKIKILQLTLNQKSFSGKLREEGAPASQESIAFEGEILNQAGSKLIHLRVPKWGGILVARKK